MCALIAAVGLLLIVWGVRTSIVKYVSAQATVVEVKEGFCPAPDNAFGKFTLGPEGVYVTIEWNEGQHSFCDKGARLDDFPLVPYEMTVYYDASAPSAVYGDRPSQGRTMGAKGSLIFAVGAALIAWSVIRLRERPVALGG